MKKILSMILPLVALLGGIAGGEMLRPAATGAEAATGAHQSVGAPPEGGAGPAADAGTPPVGDQEIEAAGEGFFTFPTQFFVPMMRNGDMGAMMILTITLETGADTLEAMKGHEQRLRDALLRQLLIHANTGGFDGNFTSEASMRVLRDALLTAARSATSYPVRQVLIGDIARQGR
ncbi:hypothetical protein [Paracoccus spongiarum]|uniref:Flagellar basal body-associated protein FliL n=1 Tax=Paracoccus spongiarum TaxID=3064387 RepID=A0ABT9JBE7_9RHOB|nr:hypothetical protein [Paracoccus sp. 2205BS29-5]MDP5307128.1 hypothetical protein [Paracoccus sp. 2205BS29-5]